MLLVAAAWIYVVLMIALAEATGPHGSVLGAVITLLLYGALPLGIVLYVMNTPHRRRARRAAQGPSVTRLQPDGSDHAPGDAVAPEREEP